MKNMLFFDNEFNAELLVNEAKEGNTIWITVDTDDNTNQVLEILIGETMTPIDLLSSQSNEVELQSALWALGATTQIRLTNDNYASEYVVLSFPDVIDTDSSLRLTSQGHYSMQGSFNVEKEIDDLQDTTEEQQAQIDDIEIKILEYILPAATNYAPIADGDDSDVISFEFYAQEDGANISFYSCLNLEIETSVDDTTQTYGDCDIAISFVLDGSTVATLHESCGDCSRVICLNYLRQNIAKGNHNFVINIAPTGGSIG